MNVYAAGANVGGELGLDPETTQQTRLFKKTSLPETDIRAMVSGAMHTAVIDDQRNLWTWGLNDDGALGRSGMESIAGLAHPNVEQVACADSSTWIRSLNTGEVWGCGTFRWEDGTKQVIEGTSVARSWIPLSLMADQIAAGANHLMLLSKNQVLTLGAPNRDALGRVGPGPVARRVHINKGKQTLSDIYAFARSSFVVLRPSNAVHAWGLNAQGELGLGHSESVIQPRRVPLPKTNSRVKQIVGGDFHVLILFENGDLLGCGSNADGQLGLAEEIERVPTFRPLAQGIEQVAAGGRHSQRVDKEGRWTACGDNTSGQLGLGSDYEDEESVFEWTPVKTRSPRSPPFLSCGAQCSLAAF